MLHDNNHEHHNHDNNHYDYDHHHGEPADYDHDYNDHHHGEPDHDNNHYNDDFQSDDYNNDNNHYDKYHIDHQYHHHYYYDNDYDNDYDTNASIGKCAMLDTFALCYGLAVLLTTTEIAAPLARGLRVFAALLFIPASVRRVGPLAGQWLATDTWPWQFWAYTNALYFLQCRMCLCAQAAFWYGLLVQSRPPLAALGLAVRCIFLAWCMEQGLMMLGLLGRCAECRESQ